jgi:hypothetical protein
MQANGDGNACHLGPEQARLSEKDWLEEFEADGQSAVVYQTTLASSHDRSLSSADGPMSEKPVRTSDVLTD